MIDLALTALYPHPRNPRLTTREDIVEQIAAQIRARGDFDPAHALLVRPRADGETYEIVAGYHRWLAAKAAEVEKVPCWVREMSEDDAYMALLLTNTQSELHPLEEGMHALCSNQEIKEYARQTKKTYTTLMTKVHAATVFQNTTSSILDGQAKWLSLAAIHAAPRWLWSALFSQVLAEDLHPDKTREHVKRVSKLDAPPEWVDMATVAANVINSDLRLDAVPRFAKVLERSLDRLTRAQEDSERFAKILQDRLAKKRPSQISDVEAICNDVETEQRAIIEERRQADLFRTKREEEIAASIAARRRYVSLEQWQDLEADEQEALLHLRPQDVEPAHFNKQENTDIEWAQFSWNPVTGCLHHCPYCLSGDTPILMADLTWRPIADLQVGDRIVGLHKPGQAAKNPWLYTVTSVEATMQRMVEAMEIIIGDQRLICSPDHRWLTTGTTSWKQANRLHCSMDIFAPLTYERYAELEETEEYRRGYLAGMCDGDAHFAVHPDRRPNRQQSAYYQFRLALIDEEAIERTAQYLDTFGVSVQRFQFANASRPMPAIRTSSQSAYVAIKALTLWHDTPEFCRGYLAGIFDAEGTAKRARGSVVRIFNKNPAILQHIEKALSTFSFRYNVTCKTASDVHMVTVNGGTRAYMRFFSLTQPAITRKIAYEGVAMHGSAPVNSIRQLGLTLPLYDIQTGTGNFIAAGIVSHNCYARDIAHQDRMAKAYPFQFAPTFRPSMLLAPHHMNVPPEAATDTRYRNVFTCSMADLFGRWVPAAWIEAVLREIAQAPQWNFLCLTKFPKRAIEFTLPPNLWMGTTVDLQARVKAAEDAFAKITAGVRWLSIEPMLEPLRFQHLERFDWMVIGGASPTSQTGESPATPEWHPPFAWIEDVLRQARAAECKVYFKTNLLRKRLLEMPFDAPILGENAPLPEVFAYLKAQESSQEG